MSTSLVATPSKYVARWLGRIGKKENRAHASNESAYHRFKEMSSLLFLIHQNAIYFLCAPNRELAEASPYFEAFKRSNKEVRQ
jgi:HSP90 family molecular chaperone